MKKLITFIIIYCLSLIAYSNTKITNDNKPYHQHDISTVNLNVYPKLKNDSFPDGTEITLGDLHGNAQKLMYFLVKNNMAGISERDYGQFVKIYKTSPDQLTARDILIFNRIISSLNFSKKYKLRILGDDLSDRGMNDYYTLKIFQAMDEASVDFEIVLSNHNKFFIDAFEREEQSFDYNPYGEGQYEDVVQSMLNLGKIITRNLINHQEVIDIVENNYFKHLVLPSITVNKEKNEITVYTHAPIDLNIIEALAKDLDIEYSNQTLDDMAESIKQINNKIHSWIIDKKLITNYIALREKYKEASTLSPLFQILWNRNYSILNCDNEIEDRNYTINYVHGHDSLPNMVNLDNMFGKGDENDKGEFNIYVTSAG